MLFVGLTLIVTVSRSECTGDQRLWHCPATSQQAVEVRPDIDKRCAVTAGHHILAGRLSSCLRNHRCRCGSSDAATCSTDEVRCWCQQAAGVLHPWWRKHPSHSQWRREGSGDLHIPTGSGWDCREHRTACSERRGDGSQRDRSRRQNSGSGCCSCYCQSSQ